MRKLLLTTVLFLTILGASAQTEKGTWMVGANVANLNYGITQKDFSVSLNPQAGYFISNNVALGANLSLGIYAPDEGDTQTSYFIGPFVRGYFGGTEKGKLFAQGNVGFGGVSESGESNSLTNLGAGLGYAYFITKNVGLETSLGYNYTKPKDFDGQSNIGLNFGFQIYLGK
jgi:outer membrane protein W